MNIKNKIINNKKKIIIYLIIIVIINLLTNYNYFLSLFNKTKPITYTNEEIKTNGYIYEIENINKKINIIEINYEKKPESLNISYTSDYYETHNHYNENYKTNNINKNKQILYFSINEKIKDLKITTYKGEISKIILNPKIKYNLNLIKTIIIFLILFFIKDIFTKNEKLDFKKPKHLYTTTLVLIFFTIICINSYYNYTDNKYIKGNLYETLYTDAIMNGKLELDYPTDELNKDKTPYDPSSRDYTFLWDASYYKGKYYCYFGIWPIISLFIPYKLITNTYLTCPQSCLIYSILGILATFILYNGIIKKYFKNINFQLYILSFIFIISGSKILWCMNRPYFYETVSLAAYFHIVLGLYLTLLTDKKITNFIGYIMLALAVLCRPTSLLYSILIIPKIINKFKKKDFKTIDFILLIIPYLIAGLFTMYINYIRFDSIFEFGTKYQLTVNNLNKSNFSIINNIFGILNYLFGTININIFPFTITGNIPKIPIITEYYIENIGGGVITTSLIGIIIFFIPKIFKQIKEKELKIHITLSLIIASIIVILSSSMQALVGRYMLDFNFVFYIISVILSLYILKQNNKKRKDLYSILITISIIINLILSTTNK